MAPTTCKSRIASTQGSRLWFSNSTYTYSVVSSPSKACARVCRRRYQSRTVFQRECAECALAQEQRHAGCRSRPMWFREIYR